MFFKRSIISAVIFTAAININSAADTYLETVCARILAEGKIDTLSSATNYVRFGERVPIFLPPYTIYCAIFPFRDSTYSVSLDFHELGPGFRLKQTRIKPSIAQEFVVDSLESKSNRYRYIFRLRNDSLADFAPLPEDSLSPRPSVHYETMLVPGSYADYKWPSRSALLESYFDKFRKELSITRAGKINLKVYSSAVENAALDHKSGIGFDIPGGNLFVVMNKQFDAAMPAELQRFVIYETWGAGSRGLAVGMARYFLDDSFRSKDIISRMSKNELLAALKDETIATSETTDMICGAFCRFIIDRHGIGVFREFYDKSAPGQLPIEKQFGKKESEFISEFIEYARNYNIPLNTAITAADMYRGLMRFDLAEPLERYLADAYPDKRGFYFRRLAQTLFSQGKYQESITVYEQLVSLPENRTWNALAELTKLRSGKFGAALPTLIKLADRDQLARKALAEYYLDFGKPDSAEVYLAPIESVHDTWTAILKARSAEHKGKTNLADSLSEIGLRLAEKIISKIPGEARGYIDAGYCRLIKGDYHWAKADFEAALFVDDRPYYTATALLGLGRLHERIGEKTKAMEYYKQAAESNGGGYNLSLAELLLGNLADK